MLMELLLGHAVGATKVASVHDRNAQVVQWPAQPIERILCTADVVNNAGHGDWFTSGIRWRRSLWRKCWDRAAVPRTRPCPRGSRNPPIRWEDADLPKGGPNRHVRSLPAGSTRVSV